MVAYFSSFRLFPLLGWLLLAFLVVACVDPQDMVLSGRVDVIVVDGTIISLAEPQVIRLNRSKSDPLTGLPGSTPLTGAKVEVLVDSLQVVSFSEADAGHYQAPDGFVGQIGHHYQLQFTLPHGTRYSSTQEIMPAIPPMGYPV
jgi:hypothetical protein